jgi:hypothetical protein
MFCRYKQEMATAVLRKKRFVNSLESELDRRTEYNRTKHSMKDTP